MCMYIHIYIYICVCVYVQMYIYIYLCVCVYIYIYMERERERKRDCAYIYIYVCVCVCDIYIYIYICMHLIYYKIYAHNNQKIPKSMKSKIDSQSVQPQIKKPLFIEDGRVLSTNGFPASGQTSLAKEIQHLRMIFHCRIHR